MAEPTSCCVEPGGYCARVDTLFNLAGVHVLGVVWRDRSSKVAFGLGLTVESHPAETGCPGCGVIAVGHGRRLRRLHDIPAFGAPVELVWRQRRYRCAEPACPVSGFSEDHPLAPAQAKLTARAAWWAISCIQRDNASVASVARRLGVDWHTVWDAIAPLLASWPTTLHVWLGLRCSVSTSTSGTTAPSLGRGGRRRCQIFCVSSGHLV